MSIDKSKRLFVLDFDDSLYNLLKTEYNVIKNSNELADLLEFDYKFDVLVCDLLFKDSDIFTLLKKYTKHKPVMIEETISSNMIEKLKRKVKLVKKSDLFLKENYLDISSNLLGYELSIAALNLLIIDYNQIASIGDIYAEVALLTNKKASSVEKAIRYYKEHLFDSGLIESKLTTFNKSYPTNTEFMRLLHELYEQKKIKAD